MSVWTDVLAVQPHVSRTLLYGPPGTGKTTLGFADGKEVYYVPLHEETSPSELIGHFVPVGDRFVWFDGPVLMAWAKGARLILDEIDQAGGSTMSILRAILNDPEVARLTLPDPSLAGLDNDTMAEVIAAGDGLRTVTPQPGFQVIATMNGDPQDLDAPLLDRFEAVFHVKETNPEAIKALPEDLRESAKRTAVGDDERRIGLRRWKAFAQLREKVSEEVAGRAVFGPRHGDILDALRLARDTAKPKAKTGPTPDESGDTGIVPPSASDATVPTVYMEVTGKRGRPPVCHHHGIRMTHRTAYVNSVGDLCVSRDGSVAYAAGTFRRRQKIGERWVTT